MRKEVGVLRDRARRVPNVLVAYRAVVRDSSRPAAVDN